MSPNQYLTDLRAERDALRAVVARVEGLAATCDLMANALDARAGRYLKSGAQAMSHYRLLDRAAERREAAGEIRTALGSTDSDPAATERQGEAGGAGDGV